MADNDEPDAGDLASAYLDGEVTADERARVEADPVLLGHVERLRQLRTAIADIAPAAPTTRDAAVLAALAAFDELDHRSALPVQPSDPGNVVPLERRRQVRVLRAFTAVAAAAVVVLGGLVIANRGGDDDDATTANVPQSVTATALSESAVIQATSSTAPAMAAATAPSTSSIEFAADAVAPSQPAAAAPAAAPPTTKAGGNDASEAAEERPVLADADQLVEFVESLDEPPPPLDDVLAACRAGELENQADAAVVTDDASVADVVVATTTDGPVAVLLGDCTVALRAPTDPGGAES